MKEKWWREAIGLVIMVMSWFIVPFAVVAKMYKAPSGGAYRPTFFDRAWFVLFGVAVNIVAIYYVIDLARSLVRARREREKQGGGH